MDLRMRIGPIIGRTCYDHHKWQFVENVNVVPAIAGTVKSLTALTFYFIRLIPE
jgi:hypothetical protein